MKLGIVSPQVLFRKALCALLAATGIFAGVVEFDTVTDLLHGKPTSQPEVLIIHTTECAAGIKSLSWLRHLRPTPRVLFLADDPDEDFGVRAIEAGAWGCVSTKDAPEILIKTVGKVAKGERGFPVRVTSVGIEKFSDVTGANKGVLPSGAPIPQNSTSRGIAFPHIGSGTATPCDSLGAGMSENLSDDLGDDVPVLQERRQCKRYMIDCPVRVLTPGRGKKRTLGEGRLHDINDKGARFLLDHVLPSGSRITFEVDFLNPDGKDTTLRYPGIVRRVSGEVLSEVAVSFLKGGYFVRRAGARRKGLAFIQTNTSRWIN